MIGKFSSVWTDISPARDKVREEAGRLGWSYVLRFAAEWSPREVLDLLSTLSGKDLTQLRAFVFLGSDPVKTLVAELPQLLRTLPQTAVRQNRDVREIRGPIRWTETTILQATTADPSRFVIIEQGRSHDLPENRALAFALRRIFALNRSSAVGVRKSFSNLDGFLRTPAIASILDQRSLSSLDRQRLRASRNRRLRELVVPVLTLHDELFEDDGTYLASALSSRIWLPDTDDKLFELWCLFRMVETLVDDGWSVSRMALLGSLSKRRPTFVMERGEIIIHVSFQTAPSSLVEKSRYGSLLDTYGLSLGQRRPDIVISTSGETARHLIIEVKLTRDRGYITESIYKVFGYVGDFSYGLRHSGDAAAVLVVWSGVSEAVPENKNFYIVTAIGVEGGRLAEIVGRFADGR